MKWSEVLSVVSSVASITGMSLFSAGTLLQSESPRQMAWTVVATICATMISIACLTGVVQLTLIGDRAYSKVGIPSIRLIYWCLAGAFSLFVSAVLLLGAWYALQEAWAIEIP